MIKNLNKIYDEELINFEISKLQDLSQEYSKFRINKKDLRKKIKLSISSDYTTNYFIEILKLFLINKKIQPDVCYSEFGSLRYNIRNLKSNFWNRDNDFFILIPSSQNFSFFPEIQDSKKIIKQKAISEAQLWLDAWSKVDKNIIQTTFDPPLIPRFGNEDAVRYGGGLHFIRLVNSILIDNLPPHVNLIDIENLIFSSPKSNWQDSRLFHLTKQPFNMETIPGFAKNICGRITGTLGMAKKVIVVDLDNTLWGGIIGDDGLDGIKLDINSAEGEAYLNFHKFLKNLSLNGIVLCVCSKNDEKVAKEVFKKHKETILKLDDFTIFLANYDDKATNIRKISKTLNLGLDSFVFIDDSKIECSIVKKTLPEVSVVNVDPAEPSEYIKKVESYNFFYFKNSTKEDLSRVKSYQKIKKYEDIKVNTKSLEIFLKELMPKISLKKVNNSNVARSSQLLAKTNQFKFNSKIFSEKELLKIKDQTMVISFKDKIQNYGIIAILVFKKDKKKKSIEIENWVMSCRVFSRRIENFIIDKLMEESKKEKYDKIIFKFDKTNKNIYLQEFLKKLSIKIEKNKKKYHHNIVDVINNEKSYIKLYRV
tara:strand:- start:1647 stop:3428 length:1782 start_codon:yes stop_codon:yes gene_type:complete